jgi:hypothetical protein
MSYSSVFISANDSALRNRVMACCAQEGAENPENEIYNVIWPVCSASDIEAAYESALISENPDPGGDPTVITDGMILSHVQPLLTESATVGQPLEE